MGDGERDAVAGRLQQGRRERQLTVEAARSFRKTPTRSEASLWKALRGGHISGVRFRRQQPIGRFIVDFCCPSRRLVIEIDGPAHWGNEEQDTARQQALEARGYRFLRFSASDVEQHLDHVLSAIRRAVDSTDPPSS